MSNKSHFFRQTQNVFTPFSYYKFENNGDDSVGTNNGVPSAGVTYVNDTVLAGLSLEINDDSDYINIPDNDDFSFTDGVGNDTACTVAFSYKCNKTSGNQFFVSKRILAGNDEWQIVHNGTQFQFYLFNSTGAANSIIISFTQALTIGNYYHIVVTYDGSKLVSGLKMYVNNVSGGTTSTTGTYTGMSNTSAQVRIGQTGWTTSVHHMNGLIDSVAFYNGEATPTQAAEIYNKLSNGIELA